LVFKAAYWYIKGWGDQRAATDRLLTAMPPARSFRALAW
jgi:hypothetical protein